MQSSNKKIFIADDDVDILQIIKMMLETQGYEVETSSDARVIFDYHEHQLPALILLDIWMSGIDGREICSKLKELQHTQHIPVILVSANSNIAEIAKNCGASGYIAKPFEMDHLLETIAMYVSR